jgi:putative oxidoreductase
MKEILLSTSPTIIGLILRLTAGLIMLPHGAQKLLGLFGGSGFRNTMQYFTTTMGIPWIVAFFIIMIESFGALLMISGTATRIWAFGFIAIMVGAVITSNFKHGLFMNWFGDQGGEGFEYHLLMIGICITLIVTGGGKYSVDGWLQSR